MRQQKHCPSERAWITKADALLVSYDTFRPSGSCRSAAQEMDPACCLACCIPLCLPPPEQPPGAGFPATGCGEIHCAHCRSVGRCAGLLRPLQAARAMAAACSTTGRVPCGSYAAALGPRAQQAHAWRPAHAARRRLAPPAAAASSGGSSAPPVDPFAGGDWHDWGQDNVIAGLDQFHICHRCGVAVCCWPAGRMRAHPSSRPAAALRRAHGVQGQPV